VTARDLEAVGKVLHAIAASIEPGVAAHMQQRMRLTSDSGLAVMRSREAEK